jgi:hypothetical protein
VLVGGATVMAAAASRFWPWAVAAGGLALGAVYWWRGTGWASRVTVIVEGWAGDLGLVRCEPALRREAVDVA